CDSSHSTLCIRGVTIEPSTSNQPRATSLPTLLLFGAFLVHFERQLADGVGNVLVGGKVAQVVVEQVLHQRELDVQRTAGIVGERAHHAVVLHELPSARNAAQLRLLHVFHGGEGLHFLVGQLGGIQHRGGH